MPVQLEYIALSVEKMKNPTHEFPLRKSLVNSGHNMRVQLEEPILLVSGLLSLLLKDSSSEHGHLLPQPPCLGSY